MAIVILEKPAKISDIQKAREDFENYIKITTDIAKEIVIIGGEYHADAEKVLLSDYQSKQDNIWAGGLDLLSSNFDCNAIVNLRPGRNNSTEILNPNVRQKFLAICQKFLGKYAKKLPNNR